MNINDIDRAARDIINTIGPIAADCPSHALIDAVDDYCDNPAITDATKVRIRLRITQHASGERIIPNAIR